ncbi:MAG: hypothetical protein LBF16_03865, partial [Pseudomonadales bacterium]|nr:hypothetical protein [Pseudomonadales bacterium]
RLFRGELAIETTDGSKLLYTKLGEFGIFARSLAGDPAQNPEERLVDDYTPLLGSIVPVADGFFYLGLTRIGQPRAFRFFDYATRTAKDVAVAAPSVNIGMTVSPDGRELLYAANAIESGTDLMLIEFAPAP